MRRSVLSLALLSLAFAPVPKPKPPRPKDSVAVKDLVGTWLVTAVHATTNTGQLKPVNEDIRVVIVSSTKWVFGNLSKETSSFDLRIDHARRPAEIDLMYAGQKEPHGRGIIERRGDMVQVIYAWGKRPTGFRDQPPNCYVLTLKRE